MKKILYILLLLPIFMITAGFRSCAFTGEIVNFRLWYDLHQGERHTGESTTEYYAIAVGEDGIIGTSESRPPSDWDLRASGVTQDLNAVTGLKSTDSTIAYAVGDKGRVLRSTDKGHTWLNVSYPSLNFPDLNGLDIVPVFSPRSTAGFTHIIAVGDSGTVIKSSNSGNNWEWVEYSINTTKNFKSVICIAPNLFVVVGEKGAVYKTSNGGESWQNLSFSDTSSLNKIVSPQYDRMCIVGNNGKIYTSSNYGISWLARNSGTTNNLRDVVFSSADSGVAVGDEGVVRLTTNGGVTWLADSNFSNLTTRNIISISRLDQNTVNSITTSSSFNDAAVDTTFFLAVSSEPFLGIEPISNLISKIFGLKQNYPNPFNPVTNIEISMPSTSFAKLIIYDIQGREIESLVNQELKAGTYKIDWNASRYPSGVYFYKLTAGDYSETKKMMLIK